MATEQVPTTIKVSGVIKEAWQLVYGLKWKVFWVLCLVQLIMMVFMLLASLLFAIVGGFFLLIFPAAVSKIVLPLIFGVVMFTPMILSYYAITVVIMLSIRKANHMPATVGLAFGDCKRVTGKLLVLIMLTYIVFLLFTLLMALLFGTNMVNIVLSVIIMLFIYYFFWAVMQISIPLVVTKKYDAVPAIKVGLAILGKHFIKIFICYILMAIIFIISAIPFGIGLLWTMPMVFNMHAILFRDIFKMQKKVKALPQE